LPYPNNGKECWPVEAEQILDLAGTDFGDFLGISLIEDLRPKA
jgi:hypothetical protein